MRGITRFTFVAMFAALLIHSSMLAFAQDQIQVEADAIHMLLSDYASLLTSQDGVVQTAAGHAFQEGKSNRDSEPQKTSGEQGRQTFLDACTQCHDAERALTVSKTYEEWMETIREMAAKEDAEIASEDFAEIAEYLTRTARGTGAKDSMSDEDQDSDSNEKDKDSALNPALVAGGRAAFNRSCLKCHDAERSLSKAKSYADWLSTVRRMASKDGADVRSADFSAIATYLASVAGVGESGEDALAGATSSGSGGWSFGTTVSTIHRSASDEFPLENPGFFADVWVTASYQSQGAWSATVTACTSCHSTNSAVNGYSLELLEGSATLDLRQLFNCTKSKVSSNQDLMLKAGRFVVPFGAFSSMSHPGVYRSVTAPLMFNMGRRVFAPGAAPPRQPVLPLPFSDEGVDLMYRARLTQNLNLAIDAYAVNGLQGTGPNVFNRSRAYSDNNEAPAFGLRTTLGGEYIRFGGSMLHGNLADLGAPAFDYTLWGVDATSKLTDRSRVYFEYARRRQDSPFSPTAAQAARGLV
ncbi:MAG: hypothetical protein KDB22_15740, partial [Planctomycetales bacterium]|nr:hypothetical protein [Planctomycetales bacterium]